jgi:hypothetical protein
VTDAHPALGAMLVSDPPTRRKPLMFVGPCGWVTTSPLVSILARVVARHPPSHHDDAKTVIEASGRSS